MAYNATRFGDIKVDHKGMYRNILRTVSAADVLDHYQAENITPQGDELIHSCLIDRVHPHHSNGDASPSASLNVEKLVYNCWSYGGGDLLWLIQELENCDETRAIDKLARFADSGDSENVKSMVQRVKDILKADDVEADMPTYSKVILRPWQAIHPYLTSRGISEDVLMAHDIGFDPEDNRIVIPHFWHGKLVGYQKRRQDDDRWPTTPFTDDGKYPVKYQNSKSFPRKSTMYNVDNVTGSSVVIVESVMSVLKAETLGFDNFVATFGGRVTETQVKNLDQYDEFTIIMDNDESGWHGAQSLYRYLKKLGKTRIRIFLPPDGMDAADLASPIQLELWLSQARPGSLMSNQINRKLDEVHGRQGH
jgi:hypothetical protein